MSEPGGTTTPRGASAKGEVTTRELNRAEQAAARRMAESKATIPHLYLEAEADMAAAIERLEDVAGESRPTVNDLVIKACGLALREQPLANSSYRDGRIETYERVNVGFAVASGQTFVVPTVFDADAKALEEIAGETRRLAERARDGSITSPELAGGTFTVSNLGMHGITRFQPVIVPGQAAILGVGAIGGEDGGPRPMSLSMACDHRLLHGAPGAALLGRISELLEAG